MSHYLSFFTWGVTQRSTLSAQDARLFLSWANATPNLQSSILLSPSAGRAVAGWQGKYYHDLHSHARSQHLVPGWSATAHGRLVALLEHIDLLAPLEEFEAALLLTAEELGLRHIQHHAVNSDCVGTLSERVDLDSKGERLKLETKLGQCVGRRAGKRWGKRCPGAMQAECEAMVRRVAPLDSWLYEPLEQLSAQDLVIHDHVPRVLIWHVASRPPIGA